MRKEFTIFMVLLSVFFAIECADNTYNNRTQEPGVPPQEPSIPIENSAISQVSDTKVSTCVDNRIIE